MANPGRFAKEAVDWLTSMPAALDVGYLSSPTFVSRELVTAIAPVCEPEELERLIAAVLSFTPYGERSYAALQRRGGAQFTLLNGIPAELRPPIAEWRLAELRRKFGMDDVPPPKDFDFQEVPAPVPAERAVKMSDAQWLRAIAKHHDDEVGRWRDGRRVGNAVTQAPVLEEICRADPQRFGRLLLRFERGTAEPYITAVLDGLTGAMVDPDLLREVCEHARRIAGNAVDRSIVRLIGSHAAADLPHTLIALVGSIAIKSGSPSGADDIAPDLDASDAYGNIEITGSDRDRGAAVFTLGALLREIPARLPLVREALDHAASDPNLAVREMAVAASRSLINFDADAALELFKTAVEGASNGLLTSNYVADFLAMMIRRGQYGRVAEVLDDMAASGAAEPSAAAVQLITLASLLDASLDPKVDAVLRGDAGGRLSVVRVCAINLKHNVRTGRAAELVMAAFDDPAAEVREAACQAFYEPVPFAQQLPLFGAFAHSAAAAHEVGGALHLLDESRQALPVVALEIFEQFVQKNGDKLGNMSTGEAAHGRLVVQLVLRVNAQSSSPEVQTRCLDLIDQLVTVSAIGIDDDLASIER